MPAGEGAEGVGVVHERGGAHQVGVVRHLVPTGVQFKAAYRLPVRAVHRAEAHAVHVSLDAGNDAPRHEVEDEVYYRKVGKAPPRFELYIAGQVCREGNEPKGHNVGNHVDGGLDAVYRREGALRVHRDGVLHGVEYHISEAAR